MLSDVGITAEVRIAPYSAVEPDVLAGDFDIFIVSRGHLLDNYGPEGFLTADFSCGGGYNLNHYCNETVDDLLAEARTLSDSEARFDIYRQIQSIVVEEDVASILCAFTLDSLNIFMPTRCLSARVTVKKPCFGCPEAEEPNCRRVGRIAISHLWIKGAEEI